MSTPDRPDTYGIAYEFERTVLRLGGEVDAAMTGLADLVQTAIDRRLPVVVDLTAVTFMDSTGCGFLAHLVVGLNPARVLVVGASGDVERALRRMRMHTVLDLEPGDP
jgi:anti-anti-sigma factor